MEEPRKDYRVKLYHLEAEGAWADVGTGNLVCVFVDELKAPALVLKNEEEPYDTLLKSKIQLEDIYERQGESIIMWRDRLPSGDEDYAVSFQNTADCQTIWDAIGEVQNQYLQHSEYGIQPNFYKPSGSPMSGNLYGNNHTPSSSSSSNRLPPVSKEFLQDIKIVLANVTPFDKDAMLSRLLNRDGEYLRQLLKLFEDMENVADFLGLNILSEIWRIILMFNEGALIQFVLSDVFLTVMGIFEYDPALKYRGNHREFFTKHAKLREVIPLGDPSLTASIHSLYRMRYLKDYILRPTIDEIGANALMGMMTSVSVDICTKVFEKTDYIAKLLMTIEAHQFENSERIGENSSYSNMKLLGEIVNMNDFGVSTHSPSNSICGVDGGDSGSDENMSDINVEANNGISDLVSSQGHDEHFNPVPESSLTVEEVDSMSSLRNYRLEGIRFIRELFLLSRHFHFERRYELYAVLFQKSLCEPFFRLISDSINPVKESKNRFSSASILERQMLAEILSIISSVCTHDVRRFISNSALPPMPTHLSIATNKTLLASKSDKQSDSFSSNLLLSIILAIIDESDIVVIEHLYDTMRYLLEPDPIHRPHNQESNGHENITQLSTTQSTGTKQDMDKFLAVFYDYYIHWMLVPFTEPNQGNKPRTSNSSENRTSTLTSLFPNGSGRLSDEEIKSALGMSRRCLFDLFTTCVQRHAYRMKYFVMRSNVLAKFNSFLSSIGPSLHEGIVATSNLRYLQSYVVKFFKAVVGTKDEFYYRHMVKLDSLQTILSVLVKEMQLLQISQQFSTSSKKKIPRQQESMIASAIVELLLYIGDLSPTLVVYLAEKHLKNTQDELAKCPMSASFLKAFSHLQLKHEAIINPIASEKATSSENNSTSRKRNRDFVKQGQEEAYFESDEEDAYGYALNYENTLAPEQASKTSKDSLQLLAEFYSDYESDGETNQTMNTDMNPGESSPLSVCDEDNSEKRRRLAQIRDLVDFGISGTGKSSPRLSSPTPNGSPSAEDASRGTVSGNFQALSAFDSDFPSFLPPIRPKFDDDNDITKEDFLKRASKYKVGKANLSSKKDFSQRDNTSSPIYETESHSPIPTVEALDSNSSSFITTNIPISFSLIKKKKNV